MRIKKIIDNYKGQKILNLKIISEQYEKDYSKKISIMTVSRILRNHLNLHFRKTILKNPKLSKENYLLMTFIFIKGILRSLYLGLNLIFIDETGFTLTNNNLKMWRKNHQEILGGTSGNGKNKINLIMAIDKNEIIYGQYYKNETITNIEFLDFLKELINKIGEDKYKNSIFILDNATYHNSDKIKKFVNEHGLKVLFTVPYKSQYNAIEFAFNLVKNFVNKNTYRTLKELELNIIDSLGDDKINNDMKKIYKMVLKDYLKFINENSEKSDLNQFGRTFLRKKKKRK